MKFYVSGKWQKKAEVRRVQELLVERGHIITADWTARTNPQDQSALQEFAERDIEGVTDCDTYIGIFNNSDVTYLGSIVEMGVALGLGKRVWLIGNAIDRCTFLAHPLVTKFQTVRSMLRILDRVPRR